MAGVKRKYIALTGITFDKHKTRVEAGAELPDKISQGEIEDLLEIGAVKAKDDGESEGK